LDPFIGSNPDIDIKNIIIHSGPLFEEHGRALTFLSLPDKNFTGYPYILIGSINSKQ